MSGMVHSIGSEITMINISWSRIAYAIPASVMMPRAKKISENITNFSLWRGPNNSISGNEYVVIV